MDVKVDIESVLGQEIESASSSLRKFAIALKNGKGLLLEAGLEDEQFAIVSTVVEKNELPHLEEAVCTVDWSWIEDSKVERVRGGNQALEFALDPAGPLVVGLGAWEGKPFLSFKPFKPAQSD